MKKLSRFVMVLLSVLMVVSMFAACGAEEPAADDQTQVQPAADSEDTVVDQPTDASAAAAAYDSVAAMNILPEMMTLNDAYIDAYYGIAAESMEDSIFAIASDPLIADTIIIVKAANGSAADIEKTFKDFNSQKMLELESYNPVQYERVSEALITTDGDYVFYIVSDDNEGVLDTIMTQLGL